MPSKSEKERREEIVNQLTEKANQSFLNSLPMDKQLSHDLFDYLDEKLKEGCDNKMTLTAAFLTATNKEHRSGARLVK